MNASLKFSVGISILILGLGLMIGLVHQKRLTTLQAERLELVAQAGKLGISPILTGSTGDARITKRQREGREVQAHSLAMDLAAFAKEMELHDKDGSGGDEAIQKRGMEIMARLMELDASQIKVVISGLRDDKSLSEDTRINMIGLTITMLGEDHPSAALALFTDFSDLLAGSPMGKHVVSSSLSHWANQDPLAALEWVRKNSAEHPDLADDETKQSIITGAARNDPKLAFKLITEMQLDDKSAAVQALVEAGKTPVQRTAILDALREHLATIPDESDREDLLKESLESMGRNLAEESFNSTQSWISQSKLSPEESAQFAGGLSYFNTKQDTGKWIDWMATTLPKEQLRDNVDNLIGQWTQQDYQAAGKWLAAAPDGPAKNASISTYAGTVAEYEPRTAVQWALTLPDGEERQATFETIYQNWPKNDAAAAAAFAKEHGIITNAEAKGEP